jgi:hypothetical protein
MILLAVAVIGSWLAPSFIPAPASHPQIGGYTLPIYRCCATCTYRCDRFR